MKPGLLFAIAFLLAPLSFCVALPIGINELRAMNWARMYEQMPHPEGTHRVALRYGIEKETNGDNCDFVIMEARSYLPGQKTLIDAFYAEVRNPIDTNSHSLRPDFREADSEEFMLNREQDFREGVARRYNGPYYLLEGWAEVESAPPLVDWRCP